MCLALESALIAAVAESREGSGSYAIDQKLDRGIRKPLMAKCKLHLPLKVLSRKLHRLVF
jgi:hypothetical protein